MLEVELKVLEGRQQGKTIPLNVRQFLIGREQDCHLRPNSDLVSRHHCVFTVDDFTIRLRDLGSTNGTFVNGERLQGQMVLKAGDHVSVGKLSFEIVVKQATARVAGLAPTKSPESMPPVPVALSSDPAIDSSETSLNVTDTIELPVASPVDDTAVIDAYRQNDLAAQQAGAQPAFLPSNPYQQAGYGVPPGYAMPGYMPGYPTGYPQAPGYPPPGYGMPPGYMPPGYGMQPMMPGYSMPQAQAPAAAGTAARTIEAPPTMLPDPEDTGAKAPPPPVPVPPPPDGEPSAAVAAGKNPSDAAADIIRNHRTRRPT